MICNLEPVGGKSKAVPEPFHPSCRIVTMDSIEDLCARLVRTGREKEAAVLIAAVTRIQYAPDSPLKP